MSRSLQYPVPRGAHCWERVAWRRVALTKKRGKKREIERSDGKLLINCGKNREKKGREKGNGWKEEKLEKTLGKGKELEEGSGKGREREKGRLGSPEGRRPATRYRKRRWNFACHVPSTFARKATMFEPPLKKTKNAGKIAKKCTPWPNHPKSSARQALGSAISGTKHKGTTWDRQRSCKIGPTTAKKPPKMPQNWPHTVLTTVQKSSKMHQKHGKNVKLLSKKSQKYHKKKQITTIWCPKLTQRGSYVSEIFQQGRFSGSRN